jgi:hypothetical protein
MDARGDPRDRRRDRARRGDGRRLNVHPGARGATIASVGFDFRIDTPPETWPASYRPQYEDAPEYFRVTHKAMHALRAALVATGAIDVDARVPSFPPWPPEPMTPVRAAGVEMATGHFGGAPIPEKAITIEPPSTASEVAVLEKWREKRAAALETTSSDPDKVPAFKLGSNDGWRLSTAECRTLGDALRATIADRSDVLFTAVVEAGSALARDEAMRWLSAFADYLVLAADHGGIVVA